MNKDTRRMLSGVLLVSSYKLTWFRLIEPMFQLGDFYSDQYFKFKSLSWTVRRRGDKFFNFFSHQPIVFLDILFAI